MAQVSQADVDYYHAGMRTVTTESSVLVSSSKYLNHGPFRELIAQEMLRRNGPDLPNTAYIPQVAQILHDLEDIPAIIGLFEAEKARLPVFKEWFAKRELPDFKPEDVKDYAPGTLGYAVHDFMVNSGYSMDHFFQGMSINSDYEYYLKARAMTHDLEHMVTGFETNFGGEIALLAANERSLYSYFRPELAAFMNRVGSYLKAKTHLKNGLHYPEAAKIELDAEDIGAAQGRKWKLPLMLLPWRDLMSWQIADIREEYGITGAPPSGEWNWTTAVSQDPRYEEHALAAE